MKEPFYITTTLPYVNADPHIGFALEIIQADALVRFKRMHDYEVFFNTGTDEHGLKIFRKAQELGIDPQTYCDEYAAKFNALKDGLNLTYTNFIRTTDPHHKKAAQEFWKRCKDNGDIYKKIYQVKYCVGCELEKTESELVEDKCPLHPNLELEFINEENYFFRFSKYQDKLLHFYNQNPHFVQPQSKFTEIKKFVEGGLEDFSVSRLKIKMPWGVPVPDDEEHVMYVWFDALVNYISALGWPENTESFTKWWPGMQVAGKDNLRQQSAMWQAMLMSAGIETSKQIFIHGFITSNGQKMSKSLGNVVNPFELIQKYGTDAVRYYLLREIPSLDDGDFSYQRMHEVYNADLANGLGNLVARVMALCIKNNVDIDNKNPTIPPRSEAGGYMLHIERFEFNLALEELWKDIREIDRAINNDKPWEMSSDIVAGYLKKYVNDIKNIAYALSPFMPNTSDLILNRVFKPGNVEKIDPLFPRLP